MVVTDDTAAAKLALGVPATSMSTLELDVGDDGSPDLRIALKRFDCIRVLAGDGNDQARIENSATQATLPPTTIEGQGGDES